MSFEIINRVDKVDDSRALSPFPIPLIFTLYHLHFTVALKHSKNALQSKNRCHGRGELMPLEHRLLLPMPLMR